jgi:drug/metabolite transporter (DMT)-like permease
MAGAGFAVAVALLATTAYHLGLILEKRALVRLPPIDARHAVRLLRTLLTSPAWLAGFALMLCGFGLQVVALSKAPVSVMQPVLGSGIVILLVLSRLVLGEMLGRLELACVLAMAAAIAAIALSATGASGQVGHEASGPALTAVAAAAVVIAVMLGASVLRPGRTGRHRIASAGVSYAVSSGLLYGVATLGLKALSGVLAGPGGSGARLIQAIVASPYPYLTFGCSALGMLIFQTGLQRCRVSIVGPVSNITGSVFFIVAGTWLFDERLPADPVRLGLRLAGIAVAGTVVVLLSRRPTPAEVPELPAVAADAVQAVGAAEPVDGGTPMMGAA